MTTRVVAREGLFLWEQGWWHGSCSFVRTRVVAREGAVVVGTRVVAREGLFLWERVWWHGRDYSCGNEGGGTGVALL